MNSQDSQTQTSGFIHTAVRWIWLLTVVLILSGLASSEALGSDDKCCLEAFKSCGACQDDPDPKKRVENLTYIPGECGAKGYYGQRSTYPGASLKLKACQQCIDQKCPAPSPALPTPATGQEKRTCMKSFIVSYDGKPEPKLLNVTKRFYDWTAKELEGYAQGGRYHVGQRETEQKKYIRGNYQPIKGATKKQDCAGYVMDQLWQTGPYFVTAEKLYEVIAKFGQKISSPVGWGNVQPNDIVVYPGLGTGVDTGGKGHVAIVKKVEAGAIFIETKDGEEMVYRADLIKATNFDAQDPLIRNYGKPDIYHVDPKRVRLAPLTNGECDDPAMTPNTSGAPSGARSQRLGPDREGAITGTDAVRLNYFASPSAPACRAQCENNANCTGFTWIKPGTYNPRDAAMCYLFSNPGTSMSQHPCCISAVKGANGTGGGTGGGVPTTGAVRYIGCFKDTSAFDLNGFLERSQSNTPQRCVQTCAAKGFAYAGVQYGQSCLCGNSYGKYGPADNCNYQCTGAPGQICGGYAANSVYATGRGAVPQPQPQP